MIKLTFSVLLLFSTATYAQSLTPEEASILTNTLAGSKPDSAQINTLLKLAKYHIFKPGENKDDLDSAVGFIKRAENINSRVQSKWGSGYILLVRSYLLRERGEGENAKESVRQATVILKNEADKLLAGEAYFDYSGYFDANETESLDHRIRLVDTAVSYFQQSGDLERVGASLYMLGDLHHINGTDFIALEKLRLGLDAFATIHHDAVQGLYSLMGRIYTRQRDYKNALNYEILALKAAEKVGDNSIQMCMINNDIARTFSELNQKDTALSYFNKGLTIAEKYKDYRAIYITTTEIANVWTSLNNPHEAISILDRLLIKYEKPKDLNVDYNIARAYITSYCILKQYNKAEPYVNQLLTMVRTLKLNDYANITNYAEAIKFYISSGQYALAIKYLNEHKKLAEKLSELLHMGNNHRFWFMLDTARHDYRSAIDHLIAYKRLDDSLFNETKSHQISELQIQYETEKKEKDILVKDQNILSLTKQDLLQKNKLQQGATLRNIIFAVVALLMIIVALLYNRYRLKQRTNRKLELQQAEIERQNFSLQHLLNEKEWLLKEIHHRVKNNLQIVMSLLNSQSAYIDNEPALTAIHDSQHRVHAMSLIHQKLYNTENVSSIEMSFYIRELATYLADSFNTGQRIRFAFAIEPLEMDVSQAVPLGLILNEAITNSLKYAFPDSRNGVVSISLSNTSPDHYLLIISDNGIGMPPDSGNKKTGSLGMSLMVGLSEDLNGTFSIEDNNGTTIKISFVHDPAVKKPDTFVSSFASNN